MTEKKLQAASRWSVAASIIVLTLKSIAYQQSHSQALLSDALESIVNVVASIVALWVIHISTQPADDEHPYGHGKAEYFSAAFEGGLVCFAGIMIILEAVHALMDRTPLPNIREGLLFSTIATLVNLALAIYLFYVSKKHHSEALKSSAFHVFSDVWTTVGAAAGLVVIIFTGWIWLDSVTAIIMAIFLLKSGYGVVRNSFGALMDESHEDTLFKLAEVLNVQKLPGIIDIHQTRIVRAGRFHHIDAHVVVPEFWDVKETHNKTVVFEEKVVQAYPFDGEIAFHVDPCLQSYCKMCDIENCHLRKQTFVKKKLITSKSLTEIPIMDKEEE